MPVAEFIGSCYLPFAATRLRASTSYGYRRLFAEHREFIPSIAVRDFRTVHGEQMMERIHSARGLGRNSLHNIKSMFSAAFKYGKRTGVIDDNPMRDVSLPRAVPPQETYAYSLDEIKEMLRVVPDRAAAVIAVAAYTGLRRGELAALQWGDYHEGMLHVRRAKWLNSIDEPKTPKSLAPVPVIQPLQDILEDWKIRMRIDHPVLPLWMFGSTPLNMDSFEDVEVKAFVKSGWKGWHAFRRGLATNLKRIGAEDVVIQHILRHSNVGVTQRCYIKTSAADVQTTMKAFADQIQQAKE
jgi:integrase